MQDQASQAVNKSDNINENSLSEKEVTINQRFIALLVFSIIVLINYKLWHYRVAIFDMMELKNLDVFGFRISEFSAGPIAYFIYYFISTFILVGSLITAVTAKSMHYVIIDPFSDFMNHRLWLW